MVKLKICKGSKFGYLTIIKEIEPNISLSGRKDRRFKCKCISPYHDKPQFVNVWLSSLRRGNTKSCGCLQKAISTTHGKRNHPLYNVWLNMVSRCCNEEAKDYSYYGGRGIKICKTWRDKKVGLKNFVIWAESLPLEKQWKPGLELDRFPNKDGDYSPKNCRFVTHSVNNRNTRKNVWVIFKGEKMLLIEAWEKYGNPNLNYAMVLARYRQLKWSVNDAIQ